MPTTGSTITKQSLINDFIATVMNPARNTSRFSTSNVPTSTQYVWASGQVLPSTARAVINQSALSSESAGLGNPTTRNLPTNTITATEIVNVFRTYARNTTRIRNVSYGMYYTIYGNGQYTFTGVPSNNPTAHASGAITGTEGGAAERVTIFNSRNVSGSTVQTNSRYSPFMNAHAVWGPNNRSGSYSHSETINFPYTGNYVFQYAVDELVTISLDGTNIVTYGGVGSVGYVANPPANTSRYITAGNHTLAWTATNYSSVAGIALTITYESIGAALAHLTSSYLDDAPLSTNLSGTNGVVSAPNLNSFFENLRTAASPSNLPAVDLRVCHSSCHNNCHGSRGRR